jgi:hypothetical protein
MNARLGRITEPDMTIKALSRRFCVVVLGGLAASCSGVEIDLPPFPQTPVSSATPQGQIYYACDQEAVATVSLANATVDLVFERERLRRACIARGGPAPSETTAPAAEPTPLGAPVQPVTVEPVDDQPGRQARRGRAGRAGPASATETETLTTTPRSPPPRGAAPPGAAPPTIPPTARTPVPDIATTR